MDHEVMDVLNAPGCFSVGAIDVVPEADEGDDIDELCFEVGGEG